MNLYWKESKENWINGYPRFIIVNSRGLLWLVILYKWKEFYGSYTKYLKKTFKWTEIKLKELKKD